MNLRTSSPIPRPSSLRRGSALLLVLGMLAFLVVSAVAFSAFMRHSRLPSSFLLRMSSSRQLVKAGLAEALDELDRAIGNNPHPGVGTEAGKDPNDPNKTIPNRNQWRNRVFLGTNMTVDVGQTVSTLTLEGLAYVPAPLINEVRYYSRRSPAAVWHTLGFDSGRFAFTAVDVSDYFDVNRMMAAPENDCGRGGRTSAEDARVSLAYLFENANHSGWRTKPEDWDDFMDQYLVTKGGGGSTVPLISWADLNLAIWDRKPAGVLSPWCRFIENGTEFVQDNAAERQALSNMVFVTDSWYPAATSAKKGFNLSNGSHQPFNPSLRLRETGTQGSRGFDDVLQNVNNVDVGAGFRWADFLAPPEWAQLADYLDVDSVPTSLALPTVERTPMVTGVYLHSGDFHTQVDEGKLFETAHVTDASGEYYYEVKTYSVRIVADELSAMVGLAYPFKHARGAAKSYNVQGFASITFTESGFDDLRPNTREWTMVPDWTGESDGKAKLVVAGSSDNKPSGVWIRSKPVTVNPPAQVLREDDAVMEDRELRFGSVKELLVSELPTTSARGVTGLQKDKCTLRVIRKMRRKDKDSPWVVDPEWPPECEFAVRPSSDDLGSAIAANKIIDGKAYAPTVQVWVRVTDPSEPAKSQTVDLVPACVADDARPSDPLTDAKGSAWRPALRFSDGGAKAKITFKDNSLRDGGDITITPVAYMTDDPRFNYAPENFWKLATFESDFKTKWKERAKARAHTRDGDIFMACSDAGYLQSKHELMYLLRISGLDPSADWGCLSGAGYNGRAREENETLAADAAMWRTYTEYSVGGHTDRARLNDFEIVSGMGGPRVCPYTPDTAVMMGALANTPVDWWAASTNDLDATKQQMLKNVDEALRYTYSDHASDAANKVQWAEMEDLAREFIDRFHGSASVGGWRDIYDNDDMAWDVGDSSDEESFGDLCNVSFDTVKFHSVDRKFLYGFWRDCFDARQQLFLVFVRAEPMMMGGGVDGYMPPMLGARAVALVWRDPTPTKNDAPHRMRVLFYRQFD